MCNVLGITNKLIAAYVQSNTELAQMRKNIYESAQGGAITHTQTEPTPYISDIFNLVRERHEVYAQYTMANAILLKSGNGWRTYVVILLSLVDGGVKIQHFTVEGHDLDAYRGVS
jgi:hypothetical protein